MLEFATLQRKLGLQGKLVLLISVLLVISITTVTIINIRSQQEITQQRLTEEAQVVVLLLEKIATDHVRYLQIEELRNILRMALEQEEAVYAYVFDEQGRIITDGGFEEDTLRHKILDDPISQKAVQAKTLLVQPERDILDVTAPVYLQDRKLGGIRVGFSLKKMQQQSAAIQRRNLLIGSGFLLVGMVLTLILARTITQPINRLIEGTRAISKGEFDKTIEIRTNDQLETLADSFNTMMQELKQSQDALIVAKDYTDNIIRSMIDMLIVISPNGVIQTVNEATCDYLGYRETELVGESMQKILAGEGPGQESWIDELMRKGRISADEKTYVTKNGHGFIVSFSASVMRDSHGQVQGIVTVAQDITKRKQAEESLRQQTKELARSNAELEQFAYVASHDLQEPLRTVSSYVQLLSQRYRGKLDADADEFIQFAVDGAARMKALINDLLVYSRVTTKARGFVPVDVAEVVRGVVSELQAQCEQTGGRVDIGALPTLDADIMQMRQLVKNLIDNALKFHRPNEPPVVKVYARLLNGQSQPVAANSPAGELCQIFVEDNGIGFDEQYTDRIFNVFQRLHTRQEYEGTGVGLAVCQKIVRRHGGVITAKSASGQGSTFIVTLPLRQSKNEQAMS